MPAPSKYTKQRVEIILEVLRACGSDARAREAADVSCKVYQEWKVKYPQFGAAVEEAKTAYAMERKDRILAKVRVAEDLIIDRFLEQLEGKRKRTNVSKEKRTRRVNGREIPVVDEVTTITEYEEVPFPAIITELAKQIAATNPQAQQTLRVVLEEAKPPEGFNEVEPGDEEL